MPSLRPSGGYRKLRSFQVTTIIYDAAVSFCERFMDKRSRTVDQMVQAARSGRQNIAEGSRASATSSQTELRLYFGVCVLQKFQQSGHGDGRFACGGYSLRAGGVGLGIEAAFKLLAQLHTGGLLDKAGKDFLEDVLRFF